MEKLLALKLAGLTGQIKPVECIVDKSQNPEEMISFFRKKFVEVPLKKISALRDLSGFKKILDLLDEKLTEAEVSTLVNKYLQYPREIEEDIEEKYDWQAYTDQLLILFEMGNFSQEEADKILLKCFDKYYRANKTGHVLELAKKLMQIASEEVKKEVSEWYFAGITESEEISGEHVIEAVEVDSETIVVESNKIYDKVVFVSSCVVSGSLVANEIQAN